MALFKADEVVDPRRILDSGDRILFKYKSATCYILNRYGVDQLRAVYARKRGRGHGTGLLKQVIEFADAHDIQLRLTVMPYSSVKDRALDEIELRRFYAKYGFKAVEGTDWMVRMPTVTV